MSRFTEISIKTKPFIKNIKDGIDVDKNYEIVLNNFEPIINAIVRSMKHSTSVSDDDLKQEAMIMLWKCCNQYDENNSTLFYSYFYGCCVNELSRYIYKYQSPLTVSDKEKERTKPFRMFEKEFYNANGYAPTLQDFVSCGFDKSTTERYMMVSYGMSNGYVEIDDMEDVPSDNCIEEEYEAEERKNAVLQAIGNLNDEMKQIIVLKFYENKTYKEISEITGLSVSKLKNRVQQALSKMKLEIEI